MSARAPILVGLLMAASALALTFLFAQTRKDSLDDDATYPIVADFTDASGIRDKTRVQISGIDVGRIASIAHVRGADGRLRARVTLRIAKTYELYDDATLAKAAQSLLGDFRLDLDPGTPGHHRLAPGEAIGHVRSLSDIDEIKGQLLAVTRDVHRVTGSFADVLSGPNGEGSLRSIMARVEASMAAIEATTDALRHTVVSNDSAVSEIIRDVAHVAAGLRAVSAPGGDVAHAAHALASLSEKLDRMADTAQALLVGGDAGHATGRSHGTEAPPDSSAVGDAGLRGTLARLDRSLAHLDAITRKVDEGQGTLGRVINDPGIADRVETTLDSANQIVGRVAAMETQLELRSQYDLPWAGSSAQVAPGVKNTLALRIIPKPDKYYLFEAISDPRGLQTRRLISTTVDGGTPVVRERTVTAFNTLKFTAMFAKRYGPLTLRFGIIENTGGLGLNVHAPGDRVELRVDAHDFDRRDPTRARPTFPRLRATGLVEVLRHVHVAAGFDDPLNAALRTWFLGGALRFTDEDLKALLVVAPKT